MIRKEDIEKLAGLARLKLSDEEMSLLTKDAESILDYVSRLPESPKVQTTISLKNVLREDGEPHGSGMHTEKLLAAAPRRDGGYIKVKPILNK